MPDLSRFASLAAKSGVVPPRSTSRSKQAEHDLYSKINAVPPVPPRNDGALPHLPHPPSCYTRNTVSPDEVLQELRSGNNAVAPVTPVTPAISDAVHESDLIDAFEECAAILEYDAGLVRDEAERQAGLEPANPSLKSDAELYADALRRIGPCSYGPIALLLGWGATRARQVEIELQQAGHVVHDRTGRGRLSVNT